MLNRAQATILLVEPDAVMRRLLALGLRQQGMRVIEADALDAASPRQIPRADLLLIDMDNSFANGSLLCNEIREHLLSDTLPIVALAWETPALIPVLVDNDEQVAVRERVAFVAKPFDARSLYAIIDDLLAASVQQAVTQPAALAAPTTSSMSIWPLVTAVGLLIFIVGFMLQIAISAVGLLIVLVALLWWTLGAGKGAPKENRLPAGYI